MGKSRIIATIVLLKHEYQGSENFSIVFPNELLKSIDEQKYRRLKELLDGTTIDLVVYDRKQLLESQVDTESFVLIDEAD